MPTASQINLTSINQPPQRWLLRAGLWCICACAICMFAFAPNQLHAGCHYGDSHFQGGLNAGRLHLSGLQQLTLRGAERFTMARTGGLVAGAWWTVGPVWRTYEGGQITFYQLLEGSVPCDSPACRDSDRDEMARVPTVAQGRQIELCLACVRHPFCADNPTVSWPTSTATPLSGDPFQLLRPPRPDTLR